MPASGQATHIEADGSLACLLAVLYTSKPKAKKYGVFPVTGPRKNGSVGREIFFFQNIFIRFFFNQAYHATRV